MKKLLFVLLPTLAVAGCASTREPAFSESFVASINEDGMKLFTYEAAFAKVEEGGTRAGPPSAPSGAQRPAKRGFTELRREPPRGKEMEPREVFAQSRIEHLIDRTNYCRNGYFIIDRRVQPEYVRVFGECKTTAE